MSSFTNDLRVKVLDDGANYEVLDEFVYYRDKENNVKIFVGAGFITDFASIPRIFWSIFPPFGKYTKAAVLHDRLCVAFNNRECWKDVLTDTANVDSNFLQQSVKRKDADNIFLEAMDVLKVDTKTKYCLYAGVRLYAIYKYGISS